MTRLIFIYFLILDFNSLKAQDNWIKIMNDTIHNIKYVFEARIDSVQSYPADYNGDEIPVSKANWKNGTGYFGSPAQKAPVYSRVYVTICRVYKGKLPNKITFLIKDRFVNSTTHILENGDTIIKYYPDYPSWYHELPLLPSKTLYPITNLYWCYDVTRIKKSHCYSLDKYSDWLLKYNLRMSTDGSTYQDFFYTLPYPYSGPYIRQNELSVFFKQVKTLNTNPLDYCK
jgi:hypothetical protein